MKELKFVCPLCGQHIQCDWKHAGENVPCPGCAALIRVPLDGEMTDVPLAAEDTPAPVGKEGEKVSYGAKTGDGPEPKESPVTADAPATAAPAPRPVPQKPSSATAVHAPHTSELYCVCPVCQSELRISLAPGPAPDAAQTAKVPPAALEPLPLDERERQIAAARERAFHPASEKPRLDRILGATAEPSPFLEEK